MLKSRYEMESLSKLSEMMKRRGYSKQTQKAYLGQAERFLAQLSVPLTEVTGEHVHRYMLTLLEANHSHSYASQAISGLRFWICKVENRSDFPDKWIRPKKQKKLPVVLSQSEVLRLLQAVHNPKHRAILALIYSAGLRVGELVRLKRVDLDLDRSVIHIRQGKGKKDRFTILSTIALQLLDAYVKEEVPLDYLFPGGNDSADGHITERSVQYVFERAKRMAGITKSASVHTLRHSFATHLQALKPQKSIPTSASATSVESAARWIAYKETRRYGSRDTTSSKHIW